MWKIAAFAFLAVSLGVSSPQPGKGAADGQGKGKGKKEAREAAASNTRFAIAEVRLIREYYAAHPLSLPPGLQKKLARGKSLPPGWQKKFAAFPASLETRLPPLCDYCGRGVIDGYAVIYDKRTRILLDIIQVAGDILR